MPKPSAISQEDVNAIAVSLLSKGLSPTVNLVQAELKKRLGTSGGTQVVTRLIANWRETTAKSLGATVRPGVPESLSSLADRFVTEAFKHTSEMFSEDAASQKRALTLYKAECDAQVVSAQEKAVHVQDLLAQETESLRIAEAKITTLDASLDGLTILLREVTGDRDLLRTLNAKNATTLEEVREQASSAQELHARVQRETAQAHTTEMASIRTTHLDEIKQLMQAHAHAMNKERHENSEERKRSLVAIDTARVETKRQVAVAMATVTSQTQEIDRLKGIIEAKNTGAIEQQRTEQDLREKNAFLNGSIETMKLELGRLATQFELFEEKWQNRQAITDSDNKDTVKK